MKHFFIPDTQVKAGVPLDHLTWAGKYAAYKKPDVIIQIGDFADMPSLSSYDVGKKCFEGRTYKQDTEVAKDAMSMFMKPIREEQKRLKKQKKSWNPKLILTLGNHEHRIDRAIQLDRKLDTLISIEDLAYRSFGFEVEVYLRPRIVDGICYSHYFVSGVLGKPCTSARAMITKHHMSCVAGHQQGRDIAYGKKADGTSITGIISGSYYQHEEAYLSPQGNNHWRGVWMFHNVDNGAFDEMPVSLNYLRSKYA